MNLVVLAVRLLTYWVEFFFSKAFVKIFIEEPEFCLPLGHFPFQFFLRILILAYISLQKVRRELSLHSFSLLLFSKDIKEPILKISKTFILFFFSLKGPNENLIYFHMEVFEGDSKYFLLYVQNSYILMVFYNI